METHASNRPITVLVKARDASGRRDVGGRVLVPDRRRDALHRKGLPIERNELRRLLGREVGHDRR